MYYSCIYPRVSFYMHCRRVLAKVSGTCVVVVHTNIWMYVCILVVCMCMYYMLAEATVSARSCSTV